ncbi:glycine-rich protein DOT1-like [Ziziphus jujuba]|uniref:Glycine-rich protein DOT1-like n=1 Tax=Ziziphus jujuba TaxID=326968 RepID=A0ABM3ZUI5_ZIZJJ|nr:glycine-rich protein DOT1-like [Ziziphus jujuba]
MALRAVEMENPVSDSLHPRISEVSVEMESSYEYNHVGEASSSTDVGLCDGGDCGGGGGGRGGREGIHCDGAGPKEDPCDGGGGGEGNHGAGLGPKEGPRDGGGGGGNGETLLGLITLTSVEDTNGIGFVIPT